MIPDRIQFVYVHTPSVLVIDAKPFSMCNNMRKPVKLQFISIQIEAAHDIPVLSAYMYIMRSYT